ncbi:hypothetical protein [Cupriavidus necator]
MLKVSGKLTGWFERANRARPFRNAWLRKIKKRTFGGLVQKKLISLIRDAKPRRALFTTFTFSLSWFEALVIPVLRASGIDQIDVLVDAREACKSTEEATALHAGNAYRIIPVYMAGTTVFHPKLAYLESPHEDTLVVSSANLTLAGHGKNLEVLDAVGSRKEPGVFDEFAKFLTTLTEKHSFSPENLAVMQHYRERAARQREKAGPIDEVVRKAWLVHTLVEPAAIQFAEHALRLDGAHTLTVLSPYHAPSGKPVQDLADLIGVADLHIGLCARRQDKAPFHEENDFTQAPAYVIAHTDNAMRPLHAKCFELRGDNGVLVMTGSVNATAQSLTSTRNVEVSLVRLLDASPFDWEEVEAPPYFEPCEFNVDELSARFPALQATWTTGNDLIGQVTPADVDQFVTLEVWDGAARLIVLDEVALEGGAFKVKMRNPIDAKGALRLEMRGAQLHASGWINVEIELAADDTQRLLAKASARLFADDFEASAVAALFGWIEGLAHRMRQRPASPRVSSPTNRNMGTLAHPAPVMTYAEWQKSLEPYQDLDVPRELARNTFEAVLKWLNRDVVTKLHSGRASADNACGIASPEHPHTDAMGGQSGGKTGISPPVVQPQGSPKLRMLATEKDEFSDGSEPDDLNQEELAERRYQQLLEAIPLALAKDADSRVMPLFVELSGCAALKRTLLQRELAQAGNQKIESLPVLLDNWLTQFAEFAYSSANRERLLPYFAALACCAAYFYPHASVSVMKEAITHLAERPLTAQELESGALSALKTNRFTRVDPSLHTIIASHAAAIAACKTRSEELASLIVLTMDKAHKQLPSVPAELRPVFTALRQLGVLGLVKDVNSAACPCCHSKMHSDDRVKLRTRQTGLCLNCKHPLFYGLDRATLAQYGYSGRIKG